jgi:hypothetical protein
MYEILKNKCGINGCKGLIIHVEGKPSVKPQCLTCFKHHGK